MREQLAIVLGRGRKALRKVVVRTRRHRLLERLLQHLAQSPRARAVRLRLRFNCAGGSGSGRFLF